MMMITKDTTASNNLNSGLEAFYSMFDVGSIIHRVSADKTQGVSGKCVLFALLSVVFMRISLGEAVSKAQSTFGFGKDVIYRFLRACLVSIQKDSYKCEGYQLHGIMNQSFTVLPKPSAFVQPSKGAFYHPSFRDNNKFV